MTLSFGYLCNVPIRFLFPSGIIGTIGWLGYWGITQLGYGVFSASFVCSLILSAASYAASVFFKQPMTLFFIPGVVPVVPGINFYLAFRDLIQGNYAESGIIFLHTLYCAGGIAAGFVISSALFQIYNRLVAKIKRQIKTKISIKK